MRVDNIWEIYFSTYKNFALELENSLSYKILSVVKCIMLIILIGMAKHGFGQSANNLSQETNFYSNRFIRNETYEKKIRSAKSKTLYYANSHDTPSNLIR